MMPSSRCLPLHSKADKATISFALSARYCFQMVYLCSPILALIALVVGSGYIPSSSAETLIHAADAGTIYTGSCAKSVCSWYGIRFAAAPVKNLRFAPPQPPPAPPAMQRATVKEPACPQAGSADSQDEDCLFLNVQRPENVSLATKLPVLLHIHGGGFETGSSKDNDPSAMIALGQSHGQPVVVVRINYRLGLLGFLGGSEMQKARDADPKSIGLNRGFQDMKMAIQWVKAHIASYGGDPNRITIWGQSAGSFGASAQMLAYPKTTPPFQAAILESGSPGGVPIDPITSKDAQYNRVLVAAGCQNASDHLSCLRAVPWSKMRSISLQESARASQPATLARGFYAWTGVIDGGPDKGGFFSDSPSAVISSGAYARVPILQGDCFDEGTYFAPHSFNNQTNLSTWLRAVYFTNPNTSFNDSTVLINQVLNAYPDNPLVGSPYHAAGASPTDRFYGPTNQYKRAASIYGDIRYQSNRRLWLSAFTTNNDKKAYSYLYAQDNPKDLPSLGVPHGSDLYAALQSPSNPISQTIARQFLAFAISYDPSASPGLPAWPPYTTAQPVLLQYENGAITQIRDNFRSEAINLLNSKEVLKITGR